jgi:hypothetical protein
MPVIKSAKKSALSKNIKEFHKGDTYKATLTKFGKTVANKQAVAVGLETQRRAKAKK